MYRKDMVMTFPDLPCQLPHIRSQLAVEKSVFSLPDNCEIKRDDLAKLRLWLFCNSKPVGSEVVG
jgi:hypothetical protein